MIVSNKSFNAMGIYCRPKLWRIFCHIWYIAMNYSYCKECSLFCQFYSYLKILQLSTFIKRVVCRKNFKTTSLVVYPVGVTKILKIFSDFIIHNSLRFSLNNSKLREHRPWYALSVCQIWKKLIHGKIALHIFLKQCEEEKCEASWIIFRDVYLVHH